MTEQTTTKVDEQETTEVTLTYQHPEQDRWESPITYTRTVRVAQLHTILQAIDDAEA